MVALDWYRSSGIRMMSMEKKEIAMPLELMQLVKWVLEWMEGLGATDEPRSGVRDP